MMIFLLSEVVCSDGVSRYRALSVEFDVEGSQLQVMYRFVFTCVRLNNAEVDIIDGMPRSRKTCLYNLDIIPMIICIIGIFYSLELVYVYVTGK